MRAFALAARALVVAGLLAVGLAVSPASATPQLTLPDTKVGHTSTGSTSFTLNDNDLITGFDTTPGSPFTYTLPDCGIGTTGPTTCTVDVEYAPQSVNPNGQDVDSLIVFVEDTSAGGTSQFHITVAGTAIPLDVDVQPFLGVSSKSASPKKPVTFTAQVTNRASDEARGVTVTITLPAGAGYAGPNSPIGPGCPLVPKGFTGTLVCKPPILNGHTTLTYTFPMLPNGKRSTLEAVVNVTVDTSKAIDENLGDNRATATVTVK